MNNTGTGSCKKKVDLFEDTFGTFLDKRTGQFIPVRRFTWRNQHSVEVQVISYGATVTSIKLPDKHGIVEDIVMGFDTMEGYLNPLNPYFGATVGRVANRIGGGKFKIDGHPYQVSLNKETFTLHGGYIGFDKVVWEHTIEGTAVIMSYVSNDGDEGFPGSLLTNIRFELTNDNEFKIEMSAYTTKPTIVNLTNHSYFNLGGHNKGAAETYKHTIQINGNKITDVDNDSIPTGELLPVRGSIFDLETPRVLGDVINKVSGGGYDQNFCVNTGVQSDLVFVARACHVPSSRSLEVYSNQPGVQFYTANFLPTASKTDEKLIGKNNSPYYRHGSFCFETQNYPDAVNHENFPNEVLRPGKTYTQITHWIFSTVNQDTC